MITDTGGPAYPAERFVGTMPGMTLLDAFAIAAMPAIIESSVREGYAIHGENFPAFASDSYSMARAMLAEKRRLEGAE